MFGVAGAQTNSFLAFLDIEEVKVHRELDWSCPAHGAGAFGSL